MTEIEMQTFASLPSSAECSDKSCLAYTPSGWKSCDCARCASITPQGFYDRQIPKYIRIEWRDSGPEVVADYPLGSRANPLRSQKAIGVQRIGSSKYTTRTFNNGAARETQFWSIASPCELPPFPFFARPCPMRPRHGFVDSRPIRNREEWGELVANIRECDEPDCEVMLMPLVNAEYSGIVTPVGFTLGPGNDGATSGHDSHMIPAPCTDWEFETHVLGGIAASEYAVTDTPYVEIVHGKVGNAIYPGTEIVQVRDGPAPVMSDRYVPSKLTVRNVEVAGGDLVAWESKAANFPEGTVVWHPGGNMTSHYAVHCVLNEVPVICTDERPEVGDVLAPSGGLSQPEAEDLQHMADAIMHFYGKPLGDRSSALEFAVGALHASGTWGASRHLMKMRGAAVAFMMRLTCMASIGESRHVPQGHGRPALTAAPSATRSEAYDAVESWSMLTRAREMRFAYYDFRDRNWNSSYGGKRWANCTRQSILLHKRALDFVLKPTRKNYVALWGMMNRAVHLAHNNGNFLNKFIPDTRFNVLSRSPMLGLLRKVMWNVLGEQVAQRGDIDNADALMEAYTLQTRINMPDWYRGRLALVNQAGQHYCDLKAQGITCLADAKDAIVAKKKQQEMQMKQMKEAAAKLVEQKKAAIEQHKKNLAKALGDGRKALFRVSGAQHIKVQVSCPVLNRSYGGTFNIAVGQSEYEALCGLQCTEPSLAGSGVQYVAGTMSYNEHGDKVVFEYQGESFEHPVEVVASLLAMSGSA